MKQGVVRKLVEKRRRDGKSRLKGGGVREERDGGWRQGSMRLDLQISMNKLNSSFITALVITASLDLVFISIPCCLDYSQTVFPYAFYKTPHKAQFIALGLFMVMQKTL